METENKNGQPNGDLKAPYTYTLMSPIQWGKDEITEIKIPKLKGKHIKNLKKDSGLSDLIAVASKASGQPMALFDEMESQDVMNITEIVGNSL